MDSLPRHSLPRLPPVRFEGDEQICSGYNMCLKFERYFEEKGKDFKKDLMHLRILGCLIHYLPKFESVNRVVYEIVSCSQEPTRLSVLGEMYLSHFIRAFRANKGRIPVPSNHASRPSFDKVVVMVGETLNNAPQAHATAKHNALIRDGYRCVVSGRYDRNTVLTSNVIRRQAEKSGMSLSATQCAHIFSESTNANIAPGSDKRSYAAVTWTIMERWGYKSLVDELNGAKVHRLENVMTLSGTVHSSFDQLQIWFTATKEVNKYKLEAISPILLQGYPEYVTFTTPDEEQLPVPSPTYLAIHAACAKVARSSGAGTFVDNFNQDMEDSQTLAPDGSDASLLENAIQIHAPPLPPPV